MKTGYKICDAMTHNPIYVEIGSSLDESARVMEANHVGALLVKDGEKLVGILTEQDIVRKAVAKDKLMHETRAGDIMEEKLHTMSPEQDIYEALVVMRNENIRHLPVMDDDVMVGLLTIKDVLKIEPQLFELIVEKFELREETRKPILSSERRDEE